MLASQLVFCNNCGQEAHFSDGSAWFPKTRQCQKCQAFVYPINSGVSLADHYQENYFEGTEYLGYLDSRNVNRKNFARKIALLERTLKKTMSEFKILEIGTASGDFLELCREKGATKLLGIEISGYCRDICHKKKISVLSPSDPELSQKIMQFKPDLIVAWDVWEHLENPAQVFDQIMRYAEKTAAVALTTVQVDSLTAWLRRAKWRQFHPPTHLCYPTRLSFNLFFKNRGFKILRHSFFGYSRSLAEYVAAIFPRIKSKRKFLKPLFRLSVYLNLYDIQIVIANREP